MSLSTAKANKKLSAVGVSVPECPVCLETMTPPIFQCKNGHSLCNSCTKSLHPPLCPICRQDMTQMRNWQLEDLVNSAKVPCPNKEAGCVYVMVTAEIDDHLKECIFRTMDCPLTVFGKCSWNGQLKNMMPHFQDRHPNHCNLSSDTDVFLNNVDITDDDRFVYLVNQGKLMFVLTIKIDTLVKMAYFTIQHIGSKKSAQQHIYEIHITSQKDARRKVVFIDHCFNDAMKTDEVFRLGKCAMLPLDSLSHYLKDKRLSFRFFIKKVPFANKNANKDTENKAQNAEGKQNRPNFNKGPQGNRPGPHGGKGPKGPGPHKNNRA